MYVHTYGSCKEEGSYLLDSCYENRLSLCIYDSRGCGESSGGKIGFGFCEWEDLFMLLNFLKKQEKFNKILLWGRSIGCNAVLQLIQKLSLEMRVDINQHSNFLPNI